MVEKEREVKTKKEKIRSSCFVASSVERKITRKVKTKRRGGAFVVPRGRVLSNENSLARMGDI